MVCTKKQSHEKHCETREEKADVGGLQSSMACSGGGDKVATGISRFLAVAVLKSGVRLRCGEDLRFPLNHSASAPPTPRGPSMSAHLMSYGTRQSRSLVFYHLLLDIVSTQLDLQEFKASDWPSKAQLCT